METYTIQGFLKFFSEPPKLGERLTLGTRELEVVSVDSTTFSVKETFFSN